MENFDDLVYALVRHYVVPFWAGDKERRIVSPMQATMPDATALTDWMQELQIGHSIHQDLPNVHEAPFGDLQGRPDVLHWSKILMRQVPQNMPDEVLDECYYLDRTRPVRVMTNIQQLAAAISDSWFECLDWILLILERHHFPSVQSAHYSFFQKIQDARIPSEGDEWRLFFSAPPLEVVEDHRDRRGKGIVVLVVSSWYTGYSDLYGMFRNVVSINAWTLLPNVLAACMIMRTSYFAITNYCSWITGAFHTDPNNLRTPPQARIFCQEVLAEPRARLLWPDGASLSDYDRLRQEAMKPAMLDLKWLVYFFQFTRGTLCSSD